MLNANPLRAVADCMPDYVLRDTPTPDFAVFADRTKDLSLLQPGGSNPFIYRILDPLGHGNGADAAALSSQIDDGPMLLSRLDISDVQRDQFAAAQTASEKNRDHRLVSFSVERLAVGILQQLPSLIDIQPIAQPLA